jgi:amidase
MQSTNSKQIAVKRFLSFILALGLLFSMAIPVAAEAPASLNTLILEAKNVNLSGYPAKYANPVTHTLTKAEKVAANSAATDEQRNIARLELQVALDTLVIDLQLVTVMDMQELVKAGKLTYAELTQMYLTRIELYNDNTNKLNAVRALNPNALAEAAARDAAFTQNPSVAKGMFGITVMLKDNINFMGLPTTAGSIALADNYAPYDAPLVTNLKTAGAIILGKLNMTEFAHGVSNNSTNVNGFSSLGRRVYSAYRPIALTAHGSTLSRLDPSGSSSGSGVAASAALAAVTIGTETNGSIISPSQSNFLVGIKPTVGIISRYGVIPLNALQDTAGPMVRNVTDAAILMSATFGYDPNDPETEGILKTGLKDFDFNECLKPGFLVGKRIGVMSVPAATAAARPAFDAALLAIQTAGATLVYQANGSVLPSITSPTAPSSTTFQFKVSLPVYLATLDPNYKWYKKTLNDVYDFMLASFQTNPSLFRDSLGTNLDVNKIGESAGYVLNEATLKTWADHRSSDLRQCRDEGIDRRLKEYNLDGLVGSGSMTAQTARGGYPHVTIPIFRTNSGQLTGGSHMYFVGTAFAEPVLIAAAYVAEKATNARNNSAPGLAGKTLLGNTITAARALASSDVAKFQTAFDAAVAAYTGDFAAQMDVDKADDALRAAMAYKYTITFVDWDGKELSSQIVEHGKSVTPRVIPKREGYTFIGWDKDFSYVTEDMTITALYEKDEVFGCNAAGYSYLVFALFGIILLRKRTAYK